MQTGYSTTSYSGLVTISPNVQDSSGSAIQWTVRTGSACIRTPFTIDCTLPVELVSFDAVRSGQVVNLYWKTATEIDAKSFVIERSLNGIDFTAIGEVRATNSKSGAIYEFTDQNPVQANSYYRLRQIDFNGDYEHSGIRYVSFMSIGDLVLVPNPAQDEVRIVLSGLRAETSNASVQLLNILGQQLYSRTISTDQLVQGWNIDLSGLAPGSYIVKVMSTEGEWIERLIRE
jgi:hypothetical protein